VARSIDINELIDEHEQRSDYRRANGAPLVSDPSDPTKQLRYRRPSGYAKILDDESALTEWRIFKAMKGVASSTALAAKINVVKDEDKTGKRSLRDEAMDKGTANEAADTGTALHAMTARVEDDLDEFDVPEQYRDDLGAYCKLLDDLGLVSDMVEVPMVNDAYRAAGTADRIYRLTKPLMVPDGSVLPPGTLVLGDLKTGQKLDFSLPGYCVQMALYADGTLYDVVTERRMPTPPIDKSWTLLIHLPVGQGRCTAWWLSVELGLRGALLAFDVNEWRNAWKAGRDGHDCFPVEVAKVSQAEYYDGECTCPEDGIAASCALHGSDTGVAQAARMPPVPLQEMVDWCQQRIAVIRDNPHARSALLRKWPNKIPTPKQGLAKPDDIVAVLNVLDSIEAEFSIPFGMDPRRQDGLRRDEIRTDNWRQLEMADVGTISVNNQGASNQ